MVHLEYRCAVVSRPSALARGRAALLGIPGGAGITLGVAFSGGRISVVVSESYERLPVQPGSQSGIQHRPKRSSPRILQNPLFSVHHPLRTSVDILAHATCARTA